MTFPAEDRKSHVRRYFGKTKVAGGEPEDNFDIWVDVVRSDAVPGVIRDGEQGQDLIANWQEDEDDGNTSRKIRIVKVFDPQNPPDDPNDPDEYVPIPVIDRMVVVDDGQEHVLVYQNAVDPDDPAATSRKVSLRRVRHVETNLDDIDPADLPKQIPLDQYRVTSEDVRDPASVSDGDYVDAEVILSHVSVSSHNRIEKQVVLQNRALLDDERFPKSPLTDDNGNPTKRIRLDPFQNIVNVKFGQNNALFTWYSGFESAPHLDDGSVFGPNRQRFYQTVVGKGPSGSVDSNDDSRQPLPDFPDPKRPSIPNAAQNLKAQGLPGDVIGIDGKILFVRDGTTIYAIDRGGMVALTVDVSTAWADVVPEGFDPGGTTLTAVVLDSDGNFTVVNVGATEAPIGGINDAIVASDTACIAFTISGTAKITARRNVGDGFADNYTFAGERISAAGYVLVTKDGLGETQIKNGPLLGIQHSTGDWGILSPNLHELLKESDSPSFLLIGKSKKNS